MEAQTLENPNLFSLTSGLGEVNLEEDDRQPDKPANNSYHRALDEGNASHLAEAHGP